MLTGLGAYGIWAHRTPNQKPWLGLVFLWVSFNALTVVEFKPALDAPGTDLTQIAAVKNLCATGYIEFLLLGIFFATAPKVRPWLLLGFYFVGLAHAISLIYDQVWLHLETGTAMIGLMGNRSIGASFTVVWLFLTIEMAKVAWERGARGIAKALLWTAPIGTAAVLVSQSGISYVALVVAITGVGLLMWRQFWVGVLLNAAVLIGLGTYIKKDWWQYFLAGPHAAAGRYEAWPMFYHFWREHFPWWFGSGLGTFKFWGPASQMYAHYQEGRWWVWAHSDWFQILFELGAVGLALATALFISLLWQAKRRPGLFGALLAYGTVMAGNYPFRVAPFALLGWLLVFEAGIGPRKKPEVKCPGSDLPEVSSSDLAADLPLALSTS